MLNIASGPAQLHRTDDSAVILVVGGADGAPYTVAGIRATLAGERLLLVMRVR